MANGISIDILANVRDALRGVGDLEQAISDVESTLEDMDKSGDSSVDKMSRGFRDLAKDADKSADKIEKSYKDAYRDTARAADSAADDAARAQRRLGEQSEEVGQEIRQNLGEGIANAARGDFAGLADTIGDTLGGTVASIGGIGTAAIGVAGALGLGAIVGAFQAIDQARIDSQERIGEWTTAFVESGGKVLTASVQMAKAQEIITDPEKFKKAEENAKNWGVAVETAVAAMTGNAGAIGDVQVAVDELGDAYETARGKSPAVDEFGQVNGALLQQEKAYRAAADSLGQLTGEMQSGQQRASVLNGYYENLINTTAGVTVEVDDLGNKLYRLPDKTEILVNAHTGQATANVDAFKEDVDGIKETVTTTVKFRADTAEVEAARRRLQERINLNVGFIVNKGQVAWN